MSYSGTPTLYGEQQIAAAYQSGNRVAVTQIAVGDGNGSPVTPTEGQTKLVNEVWRGPVTAYGVDPADPRRIVVRTTVPATAGPFVVREGGVFDANGGMIAVTALAATEVVAPGTSNQATSIDLIIALPIGSAGAITVSPTQGERFTVERLYRTPFISINSASIATPPASPAVGDLYIVPANPQGAWATAPVGTIAEWNGIFWAFLAPPTKMVAGIMDSPDDGGAEYLKWNGAAWEAFAGAGCIFTVTDNGTSTPDEFVGSTSPGLLALQPNMIFRFRQGAQANQGVKPQANIVNSAGVALGDKPFAKADGSALAAGDLPAKTDFFADYDGALMRVFGARPSDNVALIISNAPAAVNAAAAAIAGAATFPPNGTQVPGGYTFTVPAGVTLLKSIEGWGAGGGGGGAGSNSAGAGGVGGTYGVRYNVAVTPGQVIPITVGAGGAAGLSGTSYGGTGGTTSIGTILSCPGGGGGQGSANGSGGALGTGGGLATGASFSLSGCVGGGGYNAGGTNIGGVGGGACMGGNNTCGSGLNGATTANAPGGGGGGASCIGSGGVNGAVGAAGQVKIVW